MADHCGGCGIPLCEEHARKCPCCGRVNCTDWLEFNTEANDYGVPDRAGLQSVIDVIGEHYLHLAREWGWNDTEVRDAMYVETKQRGWCRE